jgi:hypothetical protein
VQRALQQGIGDDGRAGRRVHGPTLQREIAAIRRGDAMHLPDRRRRGGIGAACERSTASAWANSAGSMSSPRTETRCPTFTAAPRQAFDTTVPSGA